MTVIFHHLVHNLNVTNCKQKRESKRVTKRMKSTRVVNNNALIEFWRSLSDCACVEPQWSNEPTFHLRLSQNSYSVTLMLGEMLDEVLDHLTRALLSMLCQINQLGCFLSKCVIILN